MKNLPPIRTKNIVTQETGDEILVYDLLINKAFCLNETSAKIYTACGNHQSFENLQEKYNYSDDLINFALDELEKNDLLAKNYTSPLNSINRREVIKKIGLTSMVALPMISAIVAPSAANAASGGAVVNNCPPNYTCVAANVPLCGSNLGGFVYPSISYSSTNGTCSGSVTQSGGVIFCPNSSSTTDSCINFSAPEEP